MSRINIFGHTLTAPEQGGPYFHPFLRIEVVRGGPEVSAQLMTDAEIDLHIKQLKEDLDAVGKAAKRALRDSLDNPPERTSQS